MSPFWSRIVVALVLLPLVLWLVWLGGWWLFALALVAGCSRCTSSTSMARSLRPLVLAGYAGATASLLGAQLGGPAWLLGGFVLTLLLAFVLYGISESRQSATVTIGTTVLGVAWIAVGLAAPAAAARHPGARPDRDLHGAPRGLRGRHRRVLRRPADRSAQAGARDLAGQVVGGIRRGHPGRRRGHVLRALRPGLPHDLRVDRTRRRDRGSPASPATSSSRRSSATCRSRTRDASSAATAACSTASTRIFSPPSAAFYVVLAFGYG